MSTSKQMHSLLSAVAGSCVSLSTMKEFVQSIKPLPEEP